MVLRCHNGSGAGDVGIQSSHSQLGGLNRIGEVLPAQSETFLQEETAGPCEGQSGGERGEHSGRKVQFKGLEENKNMVCKELQAIQCF